MPRKIKSTTADDGTELELKQRQDGDYIVTEGGSNNRTGEVVRSKAAGERQLQETSRLYGTAEQSQARGRSTDMGLDSGGGNMGGGLDMGGDLFGGGGGSLGGNTETTRDDDNDGGGFEMDLGLGDGDGGGLFGGFGGGGGSANRQRDPDSGKFAPKKREPADFEMERDDDGTFSGRKDSDDDGGGLFGFLR